MSYIAICVLVVIISFHNISDRVVEYNKEQAKMVTELLVENVNSELNNLVVQFEYIANVVLLNEESKSDKLNDFKRYEEMSICDTVGFIDESSVFYGDIARKRDLITLGLAKQAVDSNETFITDPYRSSVTGQYILTVFVPVFKDGKKVGIMYANLDLRQISDFTTNNDINLPARVFIINSKSLNYLACNDTDDARAGSWNSLLLRQADMEFENETEYSDFVNNVFNDGNEGTIGFTIDERSYTLGYAAIEKMPNWYIALELENDVLSGTFKQFGNSIYKYMSVLFVITILYAFGLIAKELVKRREYQKLSTLDVMTGLYNKRTFNNLVEEYLEAKKGKNFGILIFVDVDDFKHYNDKYGHLNGDIVLKTIAKRLMEQFNSIGYVGRYGGDEFVVFVKNLYEKTEIDARFDNIRESLSAIELDGYGNVPVSVSAGGAKCPSDGVTFEELCSAADKALYQVKESGKGKFYWYK